MDFLMKGMGDPSLGGMNRERRIGNGWPTLGERQALFFGGSPAAGAAECLKRKE